MRRTVALALLCLTGCQPEGDGSGPQPIVFDGGPGGGGGGCLEGISTCLGADFQVCRGGRFVTVETCAEGQACLPGEGCAACDPTQGDTCVGDAIHACNPDGSIGAELQDCGESSCVNGRCADDDCAEGAELIYVVDSDYRLHSFDPRTQRFELIGNLDCPAMRSWPEFGAGDGRPFSMAVDRAGRAWVLFSSGEIFWVSTRDTACSPTVWRPGAEGFELFGMAFVADRAGSSAETLFVSGGNAENFAQARLAAIDDTSLVITPRGVMPPAENGAELTGDGNGDLFAYWPGFISGVARMDKTTATIAQFWNLPPSEPSAWAFAHWGGKFYIFISTQDGRSQVLRLDPATGLTEVVVAETNRRIVGAGVSTCAPVVDNF